MVAGAIPAAVLLWTHLKSRQVEHALLADVPLLPAMSAAVPGAANADRASLPSSAAPEPPPIDIDEDERPTTSSHGRVIAPRDIATTGLEPVPTAEGTNDSTHAGDENASTKAEATVPSVSSSVVPEPNHPVTKKRAWFPDD
jgi:hypothetical protein